MTPTEPLPEELVEAWHGDRMGPHGPDDWIEPIFRGPENPTKGIRRTFGFISQFDWSHDGEDDDIIAFRRIALKETNHD